jgi:hypothetical protein
MKLFTGWVIAGLVATAVTAHAQGVSPGGTGGSYMAVSDVEGPSAGPYAAMPPEAPMPGYGYGPVLLPPREVYTVVRENGFSPLGVPQQRGLFYTIAVIDRGGDDGRLVIDARNGRIVRFIPAYRSGNNEGMPPAYGPRGSQPPMSNLGAGVPRPPASVPQVASRTPPVPMPKASPPHIDEATPLAAKSAPEKSAAEKPAPAQQSAAVQMKPADASPAPQAAVPAAVEAKPAAPQILPTQEMPKVQALE